jgi:hypothetical protein
MKSSKSHRLTFSSLQGVLGFREGRHGRSEGSVAAIYSCTAPTKPNGEIRIRSRIHENSDEKSIEQKGFLLNRSIRRVNPQSNTPEKKNPETTIPIGLSDGCRGYL